MAPPRVLCVMLANGRQAMVERAIRSFASQTYEQRRLLVFDSGERGLQGVALCDGAHYVHYERSPEKPPLSIGALRNLANGLATNGALECELIAHWDSDDWSQPYRLEEQVAMLLGNGADCVGYHDMLFWDTRGRGFVVADGVTHRAAEAWLYRCPSPIYMLGTSMLYTRKIWERFAFKDRATAEDTLWQLEKRVKRVVTSSLDYAEPRMVAAIHGSNTAAGIEPGKAEWTRADAMDSFCRKAMVL